MLGVIWVAIGTNKIFDKAIIEVTQIDEMPLDNSIKLSLEHYFMVGNGGVHGEYSEEDYTYSMTLDRDIRKSENLRVGIERIKERGFFGYIRFALEKVRWVMSEGNFHWLGEGNFINTVTNPNNDLVSRVMREIFYADGKCYPLYMYAIQLIWELVQVLCIIALMKDKSVYTNFLACTIFGAWLYQILFEARSRYLILFIPFFIVLASMNFKEQTVEEEQEELILREQN